MAYTETNTLSTFIRATPAEMRKILIINKLVLSTRLRYYKSYPYRRSRTVFIRPSQSQTVQSIFDLTSLRLILNIQPPLPWTFFVLCLGTLTS